MAGTPYWFTKHSLSYHPLYRIWAAIKSRCYNPNDLSYKRYGGKGVKMCDEWLLDVKTFYDWCIANGWEKGLQIDKDIKAKQKGIEALMYSPEFCSIVTQQENIKCRGGVKKTTAFIEYKGESKTIKEWAKIIGISYLTLYQRIKIQGMDIEKALTNKLGQRSKYYKRGKYKKKQK